MAKLLDISKSDRLRKQDQGVLHILNLVHILNPVCNQTRNWTEASTVSVSISLPLQLGQMKVQLQRGKWLLICITTVCVNHCSEPL